MLLGAGCAIQPNDNTLPGQTAVGDDGYTVKGGTGFGVRTLVEVLSSFEKPSDGGPTRR